MTGAGTAGETGAETGTALVVGGTGGIGSAICRRLAGEWTRVAIGYRSDADGAAMLAREIGAAVPVSLDLRDATSIAAALAGLPDLACVVVASGHAIEQPRVADALPAQWREVIETELLGFATLVRQVLPVLRARGGGVLVAVTSFANVHFPPGDALSSVPKAGMEALCRAVAKEEGPRGIRANCVAPAMVNAGLGALYQREMYDTATWERIRRRIPLGRFAESADVAEAVAFLASSRSAFVTGQTLVVDGGQSL